MTILHRPSLWAVALLTAATAVGGPVGTQAAGTTRPPAVYQQATTPLVLRQMAQALARMHGYQITTHTTSAGPSSPLVLTSTATVVRRGQTLRLHVTTTMDRAGQVSTQEEVSTGTHTCLRTSVRSAWSCAAASSTLSRLQHLDPNQLAQALGLRQRPVPAGQHTKQGQPCTGYRFTLSVGGLHGQGMLWIAHGTALPVEEDTVGTLPLPTGASPLVVRTAQVWSRWNDPRLTIPSVPAS